MTNDELRINNLRAEAERSPISNAVFHVLAFRRRGRSTLTLGGLTSRMKKEGFNYTPSEYIPTVKVLADNGFGNLKTNLKGRIVGLKDIKMSLKSIGEAACTPGVTELKGFKSRNKYSNWAAPGLVTKSPIEATTKPKMVKTPKAVKAPKTAPISRKVSALALVISINGKPFNIELPPNSTSSDIAELVEGLRSHKESA